MQCVVERSLAREGMALAISQDERYASSLMASPTPFVSSLELFVEVGGKVQEQDIGLVRG